LATPKAIGAVREKVGNAEQESIGYDTLKRNIGDVNVSFEMLRGSIRQAAYEIGSSFDEAQKLGTEFARIANVGAAGARGIAGEVGFGGGMSRSFGLGLGSGVNTMATLRQFGVTSDETGSRRFALMIGEAVAKVGFAKADEVLAAVAQFTTMQARAGLNAPNVGAYLGSLAGLAGSGRPGLDAQGAAALLGRVNASIMGGGGGGEAGSNFMLANVGRPLGLSPIQTKMLLQQGAFGTGASTFGPGSLYADFSSKFGGSAGRGASGTSTNLDSILGGLKRSYGGMGSDYLAAATANLLGLNESQAMAMLTYGGGGALGSIQKRLSSGKISLSQLTGSGIAALTQIQGGGSDVLSAQAASLRGRTGADALSAEDRRRLDATMSGGSVEDQRQVLTELTATREQEQTEGKQTRDSIEGVEREVQKFATALVPVANTMRDALVAMAAEIAPDSEFGKNKKQVEAIKERDKTAAEFDQKIKEFDAETAQRRSEIPENMRERFDEVRKKARERLVGLGNVSIGRIGGGMPGEYASSADALMSALINAESDGNHYGADGRMLRSGKGALGITQVMPKTGADPGFGVQPLQNESPEEYRRFGRDYLAAMLRRYGGDKARALGAYNAGPGTVDKLIGNYGDKWLENAPAETQAYVAKILSAGGGAGAGRGVRGGPTADEIHATLVLHPKDPTGKAIGKPVRVEVGKPAASGVAP